MKDTARIGCLAASLTLTFASSASAQDTFRGTIDPELTTPDSSRTPTICKHTTADDVPMKTLRRQVFACVASWFVQRGTYEVPMRLVEVDGQRYPLLYVDANRDGVFADHERLTFRRKRRHRYARAEARFTIPTPAGSAFARFPVVVMIPKERLEPPLPPVAADERYLFHSVMLFATARIAIDDETVFFRYGVSLDANDVNLRSSAQSVDGGTPNVRNLSPHYASGGGAEIPVFRVGRRYVSTEHVDLRQRVATVRIRDAADYTRLELRRGLGIPSFTFRDVNGEVRDLSEFKGRYILLFFWYGGCVPCANELKNVRDVREHIGLDTLAILGFSDGNTTSEQVAPLLAPDGPFDAHADLVSAYALMRQWFNVSALPTLILLDQHRRIVSINQEFRGRDALRGPALLTTLQALE